MRGMAEQIALNEDLRNHARFSRLKAGLVEQGGGVAHKVFCAVSSWCHYIAFNCGSGGWQVEPVTSSRRYDRHGQWRCAPLPSHHDDLADRMTGSQAVKANIDVFQLDMVAHELVHRQHAAAIEVNVARNVSRRNARADVAAFDGAFLGHHVDVL